MRPDEFAKLPPATLYAHADTLASVGQQTPRFGLGRAAWVESYLAAAHALRFVARLKENLTRSIKDVDDTMIELTAADGSPRRFTTTQKSTT